MERKDVEIRVIEVRQASNGYVVTAFERERSNYAGDACLYKSWIATNPQTLGKLVEAIAKSECVRDAVDIPPARALK